MPDKPENPEHGQTNDAVTPENNPNSCDTCAQQSMFYIKDMHTTCALCRLFMSFVIPNIQRTFEEEMMANPNIQFNGTYVIASGAHTAESPKERSRIKRAR